MQITANQFLDLLRKVNGTTIVTILAVIPIQMNVWKISSVNGIIGYNYENSVNYQRIRENKPADFIPLDRSWGIHDGALRFYKNEYYLSIKVEKASSFYEDDEGNKIDFTEKKKKKSSRQGLKKEIIVRDYKLKHIKSIRMNGIQYEIGE